MKKIFMKIISLVLPANLLVKFDRPMPKARHLSQSLSIETLRKINK
jgi:hypothetical protein